MPTSPTVLAISAHAADFAWRCGGALAHYAEAGSRVVILALTFGERGESDAIWRSQPGVTTAEVKRIRQAEAERAAETLGAEIRFLDFDDFPLVIAPDRDVVLLRHVRAVRPNLVLTHCPSDPVNTDHATVSAAVTRLLRQATIPGVLPEVPPIEPFAVLHFEPDLPELCGFVPGTYLDITDVMPRKLAAMRCMVTQQHLVANYVQRAEYRGYQARRLAGGESIRYAEAYQRHTPYVGKHLI